MTAKAQALRVLEALADRWVADGLDPHAEAQRLSEVYASRRLSVRPSTNPAYPPPGASRRPNTGS